MWGVDAAVDRSYRVAPVRRGRGWDSIARGWWACVGVTGVVALAWALAGLGSSGAGRAAHQAHGLAALPLVAQGPVAAGLAAHDPSYLVRGYSAWNAAQRLRLSFSSLGVRIADGRGVLGLSLRGFGRQGRLTPVRSASPVVHANRVMYDRGAVREWYANGLLGVEQGFDVRRAPPGAGRVIFSLSVSGNLRAGLRGGDMILRGRGVSLRYGGLVATDARGRRLPASLSLAGGRLVISVDDAGAVYPLRVDPFVQQAQLTASDGAGTAQELGFSVAISGSTIVAGAPFLSVGGRNLPGAVYVFSEPSGGWANATQTAELTASDGGAFDQLGRSVAISGSTIVAGDESRTVGGNSNQGAVYVFSEPSGGWANGTQTAELTASDGAANDRFGAAVALAGSTIVAGAPSRTVAGNSNQGAVYVFSEPSGGWVRGTQTAELTASDGAANDGLGAAVAVDGSTIVAHGGGRVYVFSEPSSGWVNGDQTAELSDPNAYFSGHGTLAISGSTIAATGCGGICEFSEPSGGWVDGTETATLTPSDATGSVGPLGPISTVAVSGSTIVGGNPYECNGGEVYVFSEPTSSGWANGTSSAELQGKGAYSGNRADLGSSVGVSGSTIVAGAPIRSFDGNDSFPGAAYVFGPGAATSIPTVVRTSPGAGPTSGGTTVTITGTNFTTGASVNFGSTPASSVSLTCSTTLIAVAPAGSPGSVDVTVTDSRGTSKTSPGDLYAYGPPTISSFTPASGITGSRVTITGTGYAPGLVVMIVSLKSPNARILSGTQLTTVVPNGDGTPSSISVSDKQGSATSTTKFTPTLAVTGFSPSSGPPGTLVTINGIGFNSRSVVKFHGVTATTSFVSSTELQATVPATATTGPIAVTNTTAPKGTITSATSFTLS